MGTGRLVNAPNDTQPGTGNATRHSFNIATARIFGECARLLEQQGANPFRVNAFRQAARTLESLDIDAREVLEREGMEGLVALPDIGTGLASAINEIARTGRLSRLDRLRGSADPEALLQTVPGIGPVLARRIHEALQIDTLEGLEVAAHDGSLEGLQGCGPRRVAAISASLGQMLGRVRGSRRAPESTGHTAPTGEPDVETLLDVDRQYREAAAAGELPLLTPKRFNPERKAWLPVLHTSRSSWHFTALYSNTARAHRLARTDDWVVIYFHDDDHREGQRTVVTETHGSRRGRRVVRGRETET